MQPDPNSVPEIAKIVNADKDYPSQLVKLEELRVQLSIKGEYDKAKLCSKKAEEVKKLVKQKKLKDLEEQQAAEMENLEEQHQQDIENLNLMWDKKFQSLQQKEQQSS